MNRDQRIELRVSSALREKLDRLAADMEMTVSEVIRKLVLTECKKRHGDTAAASIQPQPSTAPLNTIPAEGWQVADQMLASVGLGPISEASAASIQPLDERTFAELLADGEPCADAESADDVLASVGLGPLSSVPFPAVRVRTEVADDAREVTADDVLASVGLGD